MRCVFFEVLITLFLVQEGDRIAQLIIEKIETPDVVEVNVSALLSRVFSLIVDLCPSCRTSARRSEVPEGSARLAVIPHFELFSNLFVCLSRCYFIVVHVSL